MIVKPAWSREGRDWPLREASRFVEAGGLAWHVQVLGSGPAVLLLHGSGSASHSWREIAPRLADRFTVVAPDLPGHGFTATPGGDGLTLEGMSRSLAALARALRLPVWAALGHSAGAAVAIRMRLDGHVGEGGVVGINAALRPFPGSAGWLFPALARMLFLNPAALVMFAWRAQSPGGVARLIEGVGSHLDARGLALYARLLGATGHIAGTLGMMARWNLTPLIEALPRLSPPLTLIASQGDRAVPPEVSREAAAAVPGARFVLVPRLGHLAHEEDPALFSRLIGEALDGAPSAVAEQVKRVSNGS